ncbi:MAG TPA: hypothetical protein VN766_09150 [Stellaceae bacterium]|nr:hypothetical protein [Stellaceae bacterium]
MVKVSLTVSFARSSLRALPPRGFDRSPPPINVSLTSPADLEGGEDFVAEARMRKHEIDDVLQDPESSRWLRTALRTALSRDPVEAAADAARLVKVLEKRLSDALREEVLAEATGATAPARSVAA